MLMEDIAAYVRDPEHRAKMSGSFHWEPVGEARCATASSSST